MRGKWLLALGAVVLLAVVGGLASLARSGLRAPAKPAPLPQAAVIPPEIILQGTIQARTVINIPAPMEGTLERMLVDVGDMVYEGQVLASIKNSRLDATEQSAQADAAKAQSRVADLDSASIAARLEASRARADATRAKIEFDQAEKAYLRQKMLVAEGATPRLVFEKAERDYHTLKADAESLETLAQNAEEHVGTLGKDLEAARKTAQSKGQDADEAKAELAGAEVHSTVDGVVVGRRGQAGEPVDRSMINLFQIATDIASLQVLLTPDSKLLPNIRAGQPALVEVAEAPGGMPGLVREVKAGQVFVDFSSPAATVKPGLTAQVKIKIS
ncbi:MAG: HlyD family secretion protein [Bryobacteraceae bacterium]